MPTVRPILLLTIAIAGSQALAQTSEHDWTKTYSILGKPSLTIETGDSNLRIHSCGDCKAISIKAHTDRKLSDYRLEESQSGDHISFLFKEKPHIGFHVDWHNRGETYVEVETPGALDLDAQTSDGNLSARDLEGDLQIHTGDGSAELDNLRGTIRLKSSDGNMTLQNASGTLEARSSDGHMKVNGNFSTVQLHSSDGGLDFTLADGSKLTAASRIESSDGTVTIRVPHDFAADLDISTSDGHIDCSLPLTLEHYDSRESSGHRMHGKVNAGDVPLTIHTSDGNVTISTL